MAAERRLALLAGNHLGKHLKTDNLMFPDSAVGWRQNL
jgi:hypothetical protein